MELNSVKEFFCLFWLGFFCFLSAFAFNKASLEPSVCAEIYNNGVLVSVGEKQLNSHKQLSLLCGIYFKWAKCCHIKGLQYNAFRCRHVFLHIWGLDAVLLSELSMASLILSAR